MSAARPYARHDGRRREGRRGRETKMSKSAKGWMAAGALGVGVTGLVAYHNENRNVPVQATTIRSGTAADLVFEQAGGHVIIRDRELGRTITFPTTKPLSKRAADLLGITIKTNA